MAASAGKEQEAGVTRTGAHVVPPGEGPKLQLGRSAPTIKVGLAAGSRLIAMFESDLPPGGGFAFPHWHEEFEEVFYVLDGQVDYLAGQEWTTAGAGSVVFVPPGVIHAFRNTSDRAARHLVAVAPAEALGLIEDLAAGGPGEFETVHERYRSHFAHDSPHFPHHPRA